MFDKKIFCSVLLIILTSCQSTHKNNSLLKQEIQKPKNVILNKYKIYFNNENCLGYCPTKLDSSSNILIDHEIILLSMNTKTKFADWVAYKINKQNMGGEQKSRNWAKDPKLDEKVTLIPGDYKGLSYPPYFFDRGHQAPLAAFKNHKKWYVVNYLSNITPQKKYLNQGSWNYLEAQERKLADHGKEIFVLTGTYYDKNKVIKAPEPKRISYIIPSGYWKIISIKEKGKVRNISFLFEQSTSRDDSYCNHTSTIENIKNKTKLEFSKFISVASDQTLEQEIGCF